MKLYSCLSVSKDLLNISVKTCNDLRQADTLNRKSSGALRYVCSVLLYYAVCRDVYSRRLFCRKLNWFLVWKAENKHDFSYRLVAINTKH